MLSFEMESGVGQPVEHVQIGISCFLEGNVFILQFDVNRRKICVHVEEIFEIILQKYAVNKGHLSEFILRQGATNEFFVDPSQQCIFVLAVLGDQVILDRLGDIGHVSLRGIVKQAGEDNFAGKTACLRLAGAVYAVPRYGEEEISLTAAAAEEGKRMGDVLNANGFGLRGFDIDLLTAVGGDNGHFQDQTSRSRTLFRSSMISSASSRPTLMRTRPSGMPAAFSSSAV